MEDSEEGLDITDAALAEARANGIDEDDLENIKGTGREGRILLGDVKDHISSGSDDSGKGKKTKKPKTEKKAEKAGASKMRKMAIESESSSDED